MIKKNNNTIYLSSPTMNGYEMNYIQEAFATNWIAPLGKNVDEVIKKAFNKKLENNRAFLEGVVSRKKQLLPNIDKNI